MAESIRFGFSTALKPGSKPRLSVEVPGELWQDIQPIHDIFMVPLAQKAMSVSQRDNGVTCYVNSRTIGRMPSYNQQSVLEGLSSVIGAITSTARSYDRQDPLMDVSYGGRVPEPLIMEAKVHLPDIADKPLEEIVTRQMRSMASSLEYPVSNITGAYIERGNRATRGLVLQVDGNSNIGVAGETFDREVAGGVVELTSNNMDIHQQQLIALAGAVALAHAEELV